MTKQLVVISSYPKSGSTWLTRLIGDVLDSPTGGSYPSEDNKEIATEGQNRSGDYIVRKGHYRFTSATPNALWSSSRQFLFNPAPHLLNMTYTNDERIIFIIRDPRDIIVSACHHWKKRNRSQIINLVCNGGLARLPAWDEYLKQWQQLDNVKWTSYEALSENPFNEVNYLLNGLLYDRARIIPAIARQSFDNRKRQIEKEGDSLYLGKEYNLNFMRKGIVGDWKNHLTKLDCQIIWRHLGEMMQSVGYNK